MDAECIQRAFEFHAVGGRGVIAQFNGGQISLDGGGLLLGEVERRFRFVEKFAACFTDHRDTETLTHPLVDLLKQRIFGLCLGYEDLNDHDTLRSDRLLAVLVGKDDPEGMERSNPRDRGKALAGKSTLNRLELTPVGADEKSRYKKIVAHVAAMQDFLVDAYVAQQTARPERIVLDFDATDDPIHGHQLGRFFHGYYDSYCYLPLYCFCGDHPLLALLRPSDIDACAGVTKHLARIVKRLRAVWPDVTIVVRGESGFCREKLLAWCEANQVDYVIGLAKNKRLLRAIGKPQHEAKVLFEQTGEASRVFTDLSYRTKSTWSRERRVVAKAEHLAKGANPRFVVTTLAAEQCDARTLYEQEYCARGNMENRIKEQQLALFADRTSCHTMRGNQLRLLFSTVAYVLLRALREFGLKETPLATAQADTIRVKLLKIGVQVRVTARKLWLSLSESCPWQATFAAAYDRLTASPPGVGPCCKADSRRTTVNPFVALEIQPAPPSCRSQYHSTPCPICNSVRPPPRNPQKPPVADLDAGLLETPLLLVEPNASAATNSADFKLGREKCRLATLGIAV